jgi:DNA excision repair protein ERCC-2
MCDLKRTLDATVRSELQFAGGRLPVAMMQGHCVLEMPSGNGEDGVFTLLDRIIPTGITSSPPPINRSLTLLYLQFFPVKRKLIYCSRTVPEIEKALAELKRLMGYRISVAETTEQRAKEEAFTGLGLTSRKNLCIHPEVCDPCQHLLPFVTYISRCPKRKREKSLMPDVEILQMLPQ